MRFVRYKTTFARFVCFIRTHLGHSVWLGWLGWACSHYFVFEFFFSKNNNMTDSSSAKV